MEDVGLAEGVYVDLTKEIVDFESVRPWLFIYNETSIRACRAASSTPERSMMSQEGLQDVQCGTIDKILALKLYAAQLFCLNFQYT